MPTYDAQQHIHLYLTTTAFDHAASQFHVAFEGLQDGTTIVATHKRALDGTGHLHVLTDDTTGFPVLFRNISMVILATDADFTTLKGLQGRRCYFFPLRHMDDGDDHVDGGTGLPEEPGYQVVFMPISENAPIDPAIEYWRVRIQLNDDEAAA